MSLRTAATHGVTPRERSRTHLERLECIAVVSDVLSVARHQVRVPRDIVRIEVARDETHLHERRHRHINERGQMKTATKQAMERTNNGNGDFQGTLRAAGCTRAAL